MLVTFLIVLGILALFGAGDAGDACAITLLLKVLISITRIRDESQKFRSLRTIRYGAMSLEIYII